jgi:hypothetical protein
VTYRRHFSAQTLLSPYYGLINFWKMAGAHRLELWTYGFGDRRSTN